LYLSHFGANFSVREDDYDYAGGFFHRRIAQHESLKRKPAWLDLTLDAQMSSLRRKNRLYL
jgi:hypothetical protein